MTFTETLDALAADSRRIRQHVDRLRVMDQGRAKWQRRPFGERRGVGWPVVGDPEAQAEARERVVEGLKALTGPVADVLDVISGVGKVAGQGVERVLLLKYAAGLTWQEVAREAGVSRITAIRRRDAALALAADLGTARLAELGRDEGGPCHGDGHR